MPVNRFSVSGHSTRREFSIYVVVIEKINEGDIYLYIGKTGDNREGCNPVISRAGNHFSYNKIHSQVRNKLLPALPHEFNYEYFYISFGEYSANEEVRLTQINIINEMERAVNTGLQQEFQNEVDGIILNTYLGRGVRVQERERRALLRTTDNMVKVNALVHTVSKYVSARRG